MFDICCAKKIDIDLVQITARIKYPRMRITSRSEENDISPDGNHFNGNAAKLSFEDAKILFAI